MIKRIVTTLAAAAFLTALLGPLSGCNTMEGAGKDIERGGKAIKDEANDQRR